MQANSKNSRAGLDGLTIISLGGIIGVLVVVVLLFTVPDISGLAETGYDAMYSAMNTMAEMCRF